jgi:hypothetical protein
MKFLPVALFNMITDGHRCITIRSVDPMPNAPLQPWRSTGPAAFQSVSNFLSGGGKRHDRTTPKVSHKFCERIQQLRDLQR